MSSRPHIAIMAKGTQFWVGGREYTRNLIQALAALPDEERNRFDLSLVAQGTTELANYESLKPMLKILGDIDAIQAPFTLSNRLRWRLQRVGGSTFNPRLQEWLLDAGITFAYPLMTATALKQPIRTAEWIPDFQYRHFPNGSNPAEISGRKTAFDHITRHAQTVVLSSAHAEKDCLELFPISQGKTKILRFRVSVEDHHWQRTPKDFISKYHLPERFMLVSNLLAPTKNHLTVIDALKVLKDQGKHIPVVFTGDIHDVRNPGFYNKFLSRIHEQGVADMVFLLGLIQKEDQFQLMRACVSVVQPSLFEGWHTGVEESQLAGKPIILSDIPVHIEQDPPDRIFFDPLNPEALADAMFKMFGERGSGHDGDLETRARLRYRELQQQYARDFIQLSGINHIK